MPKKLYEGICKYCHQMQTVEASSQEEADEIATLNCKCEGGECERRRQKLHINVDNIAGPMAENYGFKPVSDDMLTEMHNLAELAMRGHAQSIQFTIDESKINISVNAKGTVKVTRKETKGLASEC